MSVSYEVWMRFWSMQRDFRERRVDGVKPKESVGEDSEFLE